MDKHEWDERYGSAGLVWSAEPNQFLVRETSGLAPGRALDVACGEGRNAIWLAEQGWDAVGVDFSSVGLAKAREIAAARGVRVEWIEADVRSWAPDPSFDLVVVMYLHLPRDERLTTLRHAAGGLRPGGTLLVVGHDTTNLEHGTGGPQDPHVLFTPDEIVADLPELTVEKAERVRRRVVDGSGAEREAVDALVRLRAP